MKNLDLLQEAIKLSECTEVENLIKRFILSNEMQTNSKFDLHTCCCSPKDYYSNMKGIYHEKGYKYATNSHLLVKVMESYSEQLEGKIIDKKGTEIAGTFPNCNSVIPKDENLQFVAIDFKKILKVEKAYNLDKKTTGIISGYVTIQGVCLSIPLLAKLARFAMAYGITEIGTNGSNSAVKIGREYDTTAILMPMKPDTTKEEVKEYPF